MKLTEALVLILSTLASLVFAAEIFTWPADQLQTEALAVRDYSCTVVQGEVVCDRDRTMMALR